MGLLVDGQWVDQWYNTDATKGEFVRQESQFRHWVTADGSAGLTGDGGFKAEAGRYHLYVSLACPWAHRTLIFRMLKGLEDIISLSIVEPLMLEQGWSFSQGESGKYRDDLYGAQYMHQIYTRQQADVTTRVTVPVLWDKQQECIVNNESADIIRMLNSAFNDLTGNTDDYYPEALREEIDSINDLIYPAINNGVYRAGFATSQQAYEGAYNELFDALDLLEQRLSIQRYLLGDQLTEADWRLFTTLVRFDAVYYSHFKVNRQRIADFEHLSGYLRELYQYQVAADKFVASTVDIAYTKEHYYGSQLTVNPTGIVPVGPSLDLSRPHNRDRF
jgi:putative glutathione S-transferase